MRVGAVILSIAMAVTVSVIPQSPASAQDGEAVFNSLKCGSCHKPDAKATGASLQEIARVYADQDKLVKFLKGETKPVIETDKPGMMKSQIQKMAPLSEQEKGALAQYILKLK